MLRRASGGLSPVETQTTLGSNRSIKPSEFKSHGSIPIIYVSMDAGAHGSFLEKHALYQIRVLI